MKPGIHPNYRPVAFRDSSTGTLFVIGSTIVTEERIKLEDGIEYPLVTVEVSSASHPFYTGQQRMMDSQGRVEKFKKRFGGEIKGSTVRKSRKKEAHGLK
jgi:large subunit ribosomal protein L31